MNERTDMYINKGTNIFVHKLKQKTARLNNLVDFLEGFFIDLYSGDRFFHISQYHVQMLIISLFTKRKSRT